MKEGRNARRHKPLVPGGERKDAHTVWDPATPWWSARRTPIRHVSHNAGPLIGDLREWPLFTTMYPEILWMSVLKRISVNPKARKRDLLWVDQSTVVIGNSASEERRESPPCCVANPRDSTGCRCVLQRRRTTISTLFLFKPLLNHYTRQCCGRGLPVRDKARASGATEVATVPSLGWCQR